MKIERIKLVELRHDDQNARTHDQTNLKAIAGSLEQFGQRKPIVITQDNKVVAGNGTLTAAKLIGWTEIDCVRVPADWTADQIKAYALADNRTAELAQWDEQVMASQLLDLQEAGFDIEAIGFELIEPEQESDSETEDELPEEAEPRTKLGQIWQLGRHRLMCGDSYVDKNIEELLGNTQVDLILTDPPYGMNLDADYSKMVNSQIGLTGKKHSKVIGDDSEFNPRFILEKFDYCKEIFLFGFDYYADKLPQGTPLVWDKRVEEKYDSVIGAAFELIWSKKKRKREILRHQYSTWGARFAESVDGEKAHPTMKPVALLERIIEMTKTKTVLDLFGGSGSTLIAAEKTNRTCYMMELDPKYCDVIIQRWENLTGKKAELVNASR
jgi:site-specific DNA-methyltransferase (adenine-specific)